MLFADDGKLTMRLPKVDSLDALPERVGLIEQKLDALSTSVDARFAQVDKRFDGNHQQLVEKRG